MRVFGKWLGRVLAVLLLGGAALVWLAPAEPVDRQIAFDPAVLGDDPAAYLAAAEARVAGIRPGAAKRIVWAGAAGVRTGLAIVYVHGFSATAEEIRPVPDEVAQALGANLYFTRLTGHGQDGAAMARATAGDWIEDMAEAMAIGRQLGERVVVIGTSTGATLAALAATDPALNEGLAGTVMVSPNFGLPGATGVMLDLPLVRYWGPIVAGETRSFTPANPDQGRYWTTSYPTVAVLPMAALVRAARGLDYAQAQTPALFIWSNEDQVIDPARIPPVVAAWGGPVQTEIRQMQAGDDAYSHVIAGDILSPGQTEAVTRLITDWARGL